MEEYNSDNCECLYYDEIMRLIKNCKHLLLLRVTTYPFSMIRFRADTDLTQNLSLANLDTFVLRNDFTI